MGVGPFEAMPIGISISFFCNDFGKPTPQVTLGFGWWLFAVREVRCESASYPRNCDAFVPIRL